MNVCVIVYVAGNVILLYKLSGVLSVCVFINVEVIVSVGVIVSDCIIVIVSVGVIDSVCVIVSVSVRNRAIKINICARYKSGHEPDPQLQSLPIK